MSLSVIKNVSSMINDFFYFYCTNRTCGFFCGIEIITQPDFAEWIVAVHLDVQKPMLKTRWCLFSPWQFYLQVYGSASGEHSGTFEVSIWGLRPEERVKALKWKVINCQRSAADGVYDASAMCSSSFDGVEGMMGTERKWEWKGSVRTAGVRSTHCLRASLK